jgi:hypothetical protein
MHQKKSTLSHIYTNFKLHSKMWKYKQQFHSHVNCFHNGCLETKVFQTTFLLCWTAMLQKRTILWHGLSNFKIYACYEDGPLILKHFINKATTLQLHNWLTYTWLSVFDWNVPCNRIHKCQLPYIHKFVNSVILMTVYWHHSWQYLFLDFVHSLVSGRTTNISNWAHFCYQDWERHLLSIGTGQQNKWTVTVSYLHIHALRTHTVTIIKKQNCSKNYRNGQRGLKLREKNI